MYVVIFCKIKFTPYKHIGIKENPEIYNGPVLFKTILILYLIKLQVCLWLSMARMKKASNLRTLSSCDVKKWPKTDPALFSFWQWVIWYNLSCRIPHNFYKKKWLRTLCTVDPILKDTSTRQAPGVGPCLSLLPIFDSLSQGDGVWDSWL